VKRRLRLGLLRGLGLAAGRARPTEAVPGRLLLLRPDHLGDVLLTTAVLRALRRARPGAEVVALVGPWSAPILAGNPDVDAVLTYRFPWFDRARLPPPWERYAAAGALATRLRALGAEEAIVLRPDHWWGALALALAGVPRRVGYGVPECAPFLTRAHPLRHGEHVVRGGLRLAVGDALAEAARPGDPATRFEVGPPAREAGRRLAGAAGLEPGRPFVVLHPGASTPTKGWPAERWAALVDWLAGRTLPTLLVAGPGEERQLDPIAGQARARPARLARAPSLVELAGLLASARLALGLDSAAMHLATAVGTPGLRLYGPGDETLYGPWGDPARHRAVRAPGSAPDPDWFGAAGGPHPTMLALSVERVLGELADLLVRIGAA
jgi:heptosyltransferase-2/heptosyltransferase-3